MAWSALTWSTGGQPGGSWDDKLGHWDVDDGDGERKRYLPDGTEVDHHNNPVAQPGHFTTPDGAAMRKAASTVGAATVLFGSSVRAVVSFRLVT